MTDISRRNFLLNVALIVAGFTKEEVRRRVLRPIHLVERMNYENNPQSFQALYGGSVLANMIGPDVKSTEKGIQLAFSSDEPNFKGIYIMDIDLFNTNGIKTWEISNEPYSDELEFRFNTPRMILDDPVAQDPRFSPDGNQIAYASSLETGDLHIYKRSLNGDDLTTRLTQNHNNWLPAWSPDGSSIAYASNRNGNLQIYLMTPDGEDIGPITSQGNNWAPAWSPEGTNIAFMSSRDGNKEIYVKNLLTGNLERLTHDVRTTEGISFDTPPSDSDTFPTWSPEGSQIVYSAEHEGFYDLYVRNADGSGGSKRITNASAYVERNLMLWDGSLLNSHPVWNPKTGKIWYESVQKRGPLHWTTICGINPDGTCLVRVVNSYPVRYDPKQQYA